MAISVPTGPLGDIIACSSLDEITFALGRLSIALHSPRPGKRTVALHNNPNRVEEHGLPRSFTGRTPLSFQQTGRVLPFCYPLSVASQAHVNCSPDTPPGHTPHGPAVHLQQPHPTLHNPPPWGAWKNVVPLVLDHTHFFIASMAVHAHCHDHHLVSQRASALSVHGRQPTHRLHIRCVVRCHEHVKSSKFPAPS